jgi:hypothetical protein
VAQVDTPHGVDGEAHDVVVYATGSTIALAPDDESTVDGPTAVGDQLRRAASAVHDGLEHARRFHARPGPRLGAGTPATTSNREGVRSEIVRPVLVDPRIASDLAMSGRLFAEPIPRLSIQQPTRPQPANLVWTASLRTGRLRRRSAKLHVTASPSFNVTVLELIPTNHRRLGARAFLRVGLPAIEELVRRLQLRR